jgi:hypothetical protein
LEQANASADAASIRVAMAALEMAMSAPENASGSDYKENPASARVDAAQSAAENVADEVPKPTVAPKPVVAVRGDDRPGNRKDVPATGKEKHPSGRDGRPGARSERSSDHRRDGRDMREGRRDGSHGAGRPEVPRLGDAAFRAQREALDKAQAALRGLAAQAHGEALMQLLGAWEKRDAAQLPTLQALGGKLQAATRAAWAKAVGGAAATDAVDNTVLRLEIAAEVPTAAEHLAQRRMLQLQLLTQRNAPSPQETWEKDVVAVLESPYTPAQAKRLQAVLKAMLKR